MSTQYSPRVITDGLVLCLDAASRESYPGSGNVWKDLSNVIGDVNINNRNIDWSFTADPETGLPCIFNNTNRSVSAGINIPVNNGFNKLEGTIEIWLKPSGDHLGGHGWFNNSDGVDHTNQENWFWIGTWDSSSAFYFRQGNPGLCCNDVAAGGFASGFYQLNVWNHWTITWKVSAGISSVYRNSVLYLQRTDMPTNIPGTNPTNTGQLFNGHTRGDNMQFKGYCNFYKIYNRELSPAEIQQNYNALKGRFGL
jgi:hypothetical protein